MYQGGLGMKRGGVGMKIKFLTKQYFFIKQYFSCF